jgi:hypothetical protein
MAGTAGEACLSDQDRRWCRDSLFVAAGVYQRRPDGQWQYEGERPGASWHGHGYFSRQLTVLQDGKPIQIRVLKHRWRLDGSNTTCHSRPPDDLHLVRYCTLVIVLRLWAYVGAAAGFHHRTEVHPDLLDCGSDRTVQRWLRRALEQAKETQQAIRLTVIEKSEPRPMERLFRGGLSPPDSLACRHRQNHPTIETLWRALAMLLVTARELGADVSILLAEARRRFSRRKDRWLI